LRFKKKLKVNKLHLSQWWRQGSPRGAAAFTDGGWERRATH